MSRTRLYERTATMVRRTRQAKLESLAANFAIRIAKDRNDPLYKKYKKYRKWFKDAKKTIVDRYGTRGRAAARKALQKRKD